MIHKSFEWDDKKAKANFKKHGVSFEETQSVFFDDQAIQFWDDNSYSLVVDCFRET